MASVPKQRGISMCCSVSQCRGCVVYGWSECEEKNRLLFNVVFPSSEHQCRVLLGCQVTACGWRSFRVLATAIALNIFEPENTFQHWRLEVVQGSKIPRLDWTSGVR